MSNTRLVIKWGDAEVARTTVLEQKGFSTTAGSDIPGETAFPLTVLFDGAQAGLEVKPFQVAETLDEAKYAIWTGAIRVPLEVEWESSDLWFKSDLRCFLRKDEETRALLIADLGGVPTVREFPYGKKVEAEEFRQSTFHDFKIRPVSSYSASFLVIVERRNLESEIELRLDSLDVHVNPNLRG